MEDIAKAWKGQEKLWKVFWLYNILLGMVFSLLAKIFPEDGLILALIFAVISIVWAVWITVSLWRCAFNVNWKGWGYIVRTWVVISVLFTVISIILVVVWIVAAQV